MWLTAANIQCRHGFSTRHGGISQPPFLSLNLGGSQDKLQDIETNRHLAAASMGISLSGLCTLKQVHGITVCEGRPGIQEGDALVTADPALALAVSIADCYPILFYDPVNKVIGAAHAGWRGTVGKIAGETVQKLLAMGAESAHIQVAIGQGISKDKFEVGPEVILQFEQAGFPARCWSGNKIDLVACNAWVLSQNGVPEKNIWSMNRCTFENDFFSYRRDGGLTGRMWGLITMQ
jgi:polyphenol oxidase